MAARLGDHRLAAVVDVHVAVRALHSLLHQAVQERTAVVTPRRLVVGGAFELVGAWLL